MSGEAGEEDEEAYQHLLAMAKNIWRTRGGGVGLENVRLSDESAEVAVVVAGYIGLKMSERSNCDDCQCSLTSKEVVYEEGSYFNLLSRGGNETIAKLGRLCD